MASHSNKCRYLEIFRTHLCVLGTPCNNAGTISSSFRKVIGTMSSCQFCIAFVQHLVASFLCNQHASLLAQSTTTQSNISTAVGYTHDLYNVLYS